MSKKKSSSIRVRFAPSPTGFLHIGSLRTALFNWLFAHHHDGTFLVRIEDTDKQRSRQEYTDAIMDALQWTKLLPDEQIVLQSESIAIHKQMLEKLLDEGKAYRCYCTTGLASSKDEYLKYDGICRTKNYKGDTDTPFVVRIKLPVERKSITFDDLIRGPITFELDQFDDFIIARSDGTPVYNFVVVVDDAQMNITHVIRGEDHISNTPKQIIVYEALGFKIPYFAHIPLILGPSGKRLSKRDASTSALDYKKEGYLPDALCNYLVRLGWAHGDQEIFSRDELVKLFTLDAVGKKGAVFDQEKLNWLNAHYIKQETSEAILNYIHNNLNSNFRNELSLWTNEQVDGFISLYKARVDTLFQMMQLLKGLYDGPHSYDEKDIQKWISPDIISLLKKLKAALLNLDEFTSTHIAAIFKLLCKEHNKKLVQLAQPVRLAMTGTTASPGIFELLALLHKDIVLKRLDIFISYIELHL